MFRKSVRTKTFFNLKSSDKKKFQTSVKNRFSLTDEDIVSLFPSKEHISCHRLVTTSRDMINAYGCQNRPLFFETDDILYPTIFALWICPKILPSIPMHGSLIEKLVNGADLMIPGVTLSLDINKRKEIDKDTLVYICTLDNISAVAVGITTTSTSNMLPGNKGKAVHVYHTINDELCKLFKISDSVPNKGPLVPETMTVDTCSMAINQISTPEPTPTDPNIDSVTTSLSVADIAGSSEPQKIVPVDEDTQNIVKNDEIKQEMTMEELIMFSFLKALKTSASKINLPVLTNIFYKNHMLESVPDDLYIDIKKSKYKKLSNFLTEVAEKGLISLQTDKGVQSIISIDFNHEMLRNIKVEKKNTSENKVTTKFEVEEKYVINGCVHTIFSKFNFKKGDSLFSHEVRKCITSYVKNGNLVDPSREQYIRLDDPLSSILGTKESLITWEKLFDGVFKKMGNLYYIKTPCHGIISGKGKLPLIKLSVVTKASNKKVTLVDNLEVFGIDINEFSKQCQHGVAASSTINTSPSLKAAQFQIQGNQKIFIAQLLTDKYGIPKKYIEGCEDVKKKESGAKKKEGKNPQK
ncbi:eukaryotic translation initiation factor 2D [Halyomorpha halys]|uniref:eukaryotic translation initiation factor 2D n=1 Tax=Halyomorpha halys TaxID=286706 RepID=UPI0006D505B1|nr:eukaryotic translation initiation factor 2D [Halyomorpha halys]